MVRETLGVINLSSSNRVSLTPYRGLAIVGDVSQAGSLLRFPMPLYESLSSNTYRRG
jgi:hypothetical protein